MGAHPDDIILMRTDSMGDTLWMRSYGDSGQETVRHFELLSNGGYAMIGDSAGFMWLILTDSLGNVLRDTSTVAVSEVHGSQLRVYPNPVSDRLFVEYSSEPGKIEIWDAAGKWYKPETKKVENRLFISTVTLADGLYFLKIIDEYGVRIARFVKKH